jgi:hypothetical protein
MNCYLDIDDWWTRSDYRRWLGDKVVAHAATEGAAVYVDGRRWEITKIDDRWTATSGIEIFDQVAENGLWDVISLIDKIVNRHGINRNRGLRS